MPQPVIVEALRTPVGKRGGALKDVRPDHLAAYLLRELFTRVALDPALVDDVLFGCVDQVGEQAVNVGRTAWLAAGLPAQVPALTLDRQCGSSQSAVNLGAALIAAGTADVVVAGGVESMTRVPMLGNADVHGKPFGYLYREQYPVVSQGIAAELIAEKWGISREDLDAFAYESHLRAGRAIREGRFADETVPVPVGRLSGPAEGVDMRQANEVPPGWNAGADGHRGSEGATGAAAGAAGSAAGAADAADGPWFLVDEGPRMEPSLEAMAALRPVFKEDGRITAATSSQISDGASVVLLTSAEKARELGLRPRAQVVAQATVGVDPVTMLTGPIPATRKVLARSGLAIADVDVVEINEAFASVVLAWQRELQPDMERVNVNGGAIALGHPLGATGGKLTATLLHELERCDGRFGLVTMCCGGGLGVATLLERLAG